MNLRLVAPMGTMKEGETLYARTQEQADQLVSQGYAEHIEDDEVVEKELVLLNPAPGVYTTAWQNVETKQEPEVSAATANSNTSETETLIITTAKDLIEKINAATTVEDVKQLVPESETRKTVTDAATKKIDELSKG